MYLVVDNFKAMQVFTKMPSFETSLLDMLLVDFWMLLDWVSLIWTSVYFLSFELAFNVYKTKAKTVIA